MWSFKSVPIPKFICAPKNIARLKKTIPSSYLWCFLKMCAQYIFHNLFDKFISVCICCVWVSIERAMVDCFVFCAYEKCSYLIFELCIYPWQIINQISALFRPLLTKLPLQQMLWAVCILYLQMNDLQTKFHLKAIEAIWQEILTLSFWVGSGHYQWITFRLKSPWFV